LSHNEDAQSNTHLETHIIRHKKLNSHKDTKTFRHTELRHTNSHIQLHTHTNRHTNTSRTVRKPMKLRSSATDVATYTTHNKRKIENLSITYYLGAFEKQLVTLKINIKYSKCVVIVFLCSACNENGPLVICGLYGHMIFLYIIS